MEKKISLTVLLVTVALSIPTCKAGFSPKEVNRYFWVDKTQYKPGDTITLYLTILNARTSDLVIYNMSINTPWYMYIKDHWEGNQTIQVNPKVMAPSQSYYNYTSIQVPSDGRAFTQNSYVILHIITETNAGSFHDSITVGMVNPPVYSSVREIDTVNLLLAVLIILIVVCTALIAAAIFLSARKPYETTPEPPKSS